MGLDPDGLPIGLQIVGRRFHDPLVLRIGQAYEAMRGPFPTAP
jgi:amidase